MNEASPPPFPQASPRKGLPPLAWAGIGCGGLIVVAVVLVIVFAARIGMSVAKGFKEHPAKDAASEVVNAFPDIQKEAESPEEGKLTLHSKSTGERVPASYDD